MKRLDTLSIVLTAAQIAAYGCGTGAISSQSIQAEVRASSDLPPNTSEQVANLVNDARLRQWRDYDLSKDTQVTIVYFLGKKVPALVKKYDGMHDYQLPKVTSDTVNPHYPGDAYLSLGEVVIFQPAGNGNLYRQRWAFSSDDKGQNLFLPIDRAAIYPSGASFADDFNDTFATLAHPEERLVLQWNRSDAAPRLQLLPQK